MTTIDWQARALAAEADAAAFRLALDRVLTAIDEVESEPGRGAAPIFRVDWYAEMKRAKEPGAGSDLLAAVRRARDVLKWLVGERSRCGDPDAECVLFDVHKPDHDVPEALAELSKWVGE